METVALILGSLFVGEAGYWLALKIRLLRMELQMREEQLRDMRIDMLSPSAYLHELKGEHQNG